MHDFYDLSTGFFQHENLWRIDATLFVIDSNSYGFAATLQNNHN